MRVPIELEFALFLRLCTHKEMNRSEDFPGGLINGLTTQKMAPFSEQQ